MQKHFHLTSRDLHCVLQIQVTVCGVLTLTSCDLHYVFPLQILVTGCFNLTAYTLHYEGPFECRTVQYVTGALIGAAVLVAVVLVACCRGRCCGARRGGARPLPRKNGMLGVLNVPWRYPRLPPVSRGCRGGGSRGSGCRGGNSGGAA